MHNPGSNSNMHTEVSRPMDVSTPRVVIVWRSPFELGTPHVVELPPGFTLQEIVNLLGDLPDDFQQNGLIHVNGEEIPNALWARVKPKPDCKDHPIAVTLHYRMHGGDDGKNVLGVVVALATIAITGFVTAGGLASTLGPKFAQGALGARIAAAGVSVIGALAVTALTPPPAIPSRDQDSSGDSTDRASSANVGVRGNLLAPNATVPRVIGTHRILPPFGVEPYIELEGQSEVVNAVYVLAGAHELDEFRLEDQPVDISTALVDEGITIETRTGTTGSETIQLNQLQTRTVEYNTELSAHRTLPDAPDTLATSTFNEPVWHGLASREGCDELWIHLVNGGLQRAAAPTETLRVPFRLRMRLRGTSTWRNLPELHFIGNVLGQYKTQIKLIWGDYSTPVTPVASLSTLGFVEARKKSPGQAVSPTGSDFDADAYFSAGAGNDYLTASTVPSSNVTHVQLTDTGVFIYLDEAQWPKGAYEVEIKRGATIINTSYVPSAYTYSGTVLDFFSNQNGKIPLTRDGLVDSFGVQRGISVWNEFPLDQSNLTIIKLQAVDRSVGQLSVLASGIIHEYGGPTFSNTPDATPAAGTILNATFGDRTDDAVFECTVKFPKEYLSDGLNHILMECGDTTNGFTVGIGSDPSTPPVFIVRAGDGSPSVQFTSADTPVMRIDAGMLPFDDLFHTVRVELNWSGSIASVALWIDEVFISEEFALSSKTASWANTADGGFTQASGTVAGGYTVTNWDASTGISNLDIHNAVTVDRSTHAWKVPAKSHNPASWYVEVLSGSLNYRPLPDDLRDDATLLEWRDVCFKSGYSCDMISEGLGLLDHLNIIASCGYARPYQSEVWGVTRDYDRSAEAPVQIFTSRNTRDFSFSKAFPIQPAGLRINYNSRLFDYREQQEQVFRIGAIGSDFLVEQTTYKGFVDSRKVVDRGLFDLQQAHHRNAFYSLKAPFEWIRCRKGSLVGVEQDILEDEYASMRIKSLQLSGDNLTGVTLDGDIKAWNEGDMSSITDMFAVDDMFTIGRQTALAIRRNDGTTTVHTISTATSTTDTVTFTTPIANAVDAGLKSPYDTGDVRPIDVDCLAIIGMAAKEYDRMIVLDIQPENNLEAELTLVDEAPEIWTTAA